MTGRPKVLYVLHNHPVVRPGGAETYALELYEFVRDHGELDPVLLARTGPPMSSVERYREGTLLTMVNDDPNQYFFYTEKDDFDWLNGTSRSKTLYTRFFREFLLAHRPDVVHFQHTLFFGYDVLRETRNTLPDASIVYTLHEFLPICHRNGQMVRVGSDETCLESSPRRCHECFPHISPQSFFLRKRFISSHLALVDQFLAPSRFLLERYVDWGLPRHKVRYEEYGRLRTSGLVPPSETGEQRPRNRFGFFGQLNHFKGVTVLLKAMAILAKERSDAHLWLHGANLELQPEAFRNELAELLEGADNVTFVGRYDRGEQARLMANVDWVVVPSIWWENSPLVIQEAFQCGRPVICSDIGGMAEKVVHGEDGLHFRAGDPESLARAIGEAERGRDVWEQLRAGIREVYSMEEHAAALTELYRELLDRHAQGILV